MDVPQLIRDAFPVGSDRVSLELVDVEIQPAGGMTATVRLVIWDVDGETRSIRDIREQQIWLGDAAILAADPRTPVAIQGWRLAIEHLFAQDDLGWVDCLMPHELMPRLVDLLALKRPRDAEDFADALLASKQRLGRWLKA